MENEKKIISIGSDAPNFTLKDQDNRDFHLSGYRAKKILLSFHPLAWMGICASQMKALEKCKDILNRLNTIAVGISVDSVQTIAEWAKNLGIKNTLLLSDFWPHGKVASLYDIFREQEGYSGRANIIIDNNQKIAFIKIYEMTQLPDIKEIIDFLNTMK